MGVLGDYSKNKEDSLETFLFYANDQGTECQLRLISKGITKKNPPCYD